MLQLRTWVLYGLRAPTPKGSHRTWTTPGSWQCNQDDQCSPTVEPQVTELLLNAHTYWGHDPSLGDGDLGLSLDHLPASKVIQ